jgi:hypothetical protein
MTTRWLLSIAALTSLALLFGTANAHAAKGVKKNPKNGEHHVHGEVVAVHHTNTGGTITIKVHHHRKKAVAPAPAPVAGAKAHHSHRTFHVNQATKFFISHKGQHQPATFAAVHKGEHVGILAKGHTAEVVNIHHHHHHMKGKPGTPAVKPNVVPPTPKPMVPTIRKPKK